MQEEQLGSGFQKKGTPLPVQNRRCRVVILFIYKRDTAPTNDPCCASGRASAELPKSFGGEVLEDRFPGGLAICPVMGIEYVNDGLDQIM